MLERVVAQLEAGQRPPQMVIRRLLGDLGLNDFIHLYSHGEYEVLGGLLREFISEPDPPMP